MDPEVLTTNGQVPHDEACRSLGTSTVFGRLQAQATELARLTSLSFVRVGNEGRFWFLFSESGREECSSGRNDAPGLRVLGAKLRLHQVFWSQNLALQSQNATMRPEFSSPGSAQLIQAKVRKASVPSLFFLLWTSRSTCGSRTARWTRTAPGHGCRIDSENEARCSSAD